MKKLYIFLVLTFLLIQFSFLPFFLESSLIPNLILIGAVVVGIKKSLRESLGWFFLAGILFEIFSAGFFGMYLIIFLLIGLLVWILKNIILNKETNILIESVLFVFVKIIWDVFFRIEQFVSNFFIKEKISFDYNVFLSWNYFQSLVIFVFSCLMVSLFWNFLRNNFLKKS